MSRPLRIFFHDAFYHVMNRGTAQQKIFQIDDDKLLFLFCIADAHDMFNLNVHSYCLMDNHYHLLVSTLDANLDRAMRHINGVYTQKYNKRYERDGALFRGRYKAILVENNQYLANVSRYIHLNPVAAGLVKSASEFMWSSHNYFILNQAPPPPRWLQTKDILALFDGRKDSSTARTEYADFVNSGLDDDTSDFYNASRLKPIIGTDKFIEEKRQILGNEKYESSEHEINLIKTRLSIELPIISTAQYYQIEKQKVTSKCQGTKNKPRDVAMYVARYRFGHLIKDIANAFQYKKINSVAARLQKIRYMIENDTSMMSDVHYIADDCYARAIVMREQEESD